MVTNDVHQEIPPADFGDGYHIYKQLLRRKRTDRPQWSTLQKAAAFKSALNVNTQSRRVFASAKRYLGVAPLLAKSGDVICLLYGGRVPYILRPKNDHFLLVGESYIHGLMYGEAMSWPGIVEQNIELR
jgi:hypothetical protein